MPAGLGWISALIKLLKNEELDFNEAEKTAEEKYRLYPDYKDAFSRLAYFLMHIECCEKAIELFEKDFFLSRQTWWGKLRHAECIAHCGDKKRAFEKVSDVYSSFNEAVNGFGHIGWSLLRKKKADKAEAVEIIKKDIDLNRMTNGFKLVAADIIVSCDEICAENLISSVYEADPSAKDCFARLGRKLIYERKFVKAEALYSKDAELKKLSPSEFVIYAELLARSGRLDMAEKCTEDAYRRDETLKDFYSRLLPHSSVFDVTRFEYLLSRDKERGRASGNYSELDSFRIEQNNKFISELTNAYGSEFALRTEAFDRKIREFLFESSTADIFKFSIMKSGLESDLARINKIKTITADDYSGNIRSDYTEWCYTKRKKILLINTCYNFVTNQNASFGPPFGLLSIATALDTAGYEVIFVDPQVDDDYERMIDEALTDGVLFAGISTYMGSNLKNSVTLTERIKEINPDVPVVWGGPLASSAPETCFRESLVDYIVMGQGDVSVIELADCLNENRADKITNHPHISSKNRDGYVVIGIPCTENREKDGVARIDLRFWEKGVRKQGTVHLLSSSGCPYSCSFCYNLFNGNKKVAFKSAESVFDEMDRAAEMFSSNIFLFNDDNFLMNEERALRIFAFTRKRGYKISWLQGHCSNFTPKIQEEIIKGRILVNMNIESASPKIRKLLNKHVHIEKSLNIIKNFSDAGVPFQTAFMFGFPGEDEEDIQYNIGLAKKIKEISGGLARSAFHFYCPQPMDGIVKSYISKNEDIEFSLNDMSELTFLPVPPNDSINLKIRPWMDEGKANYYRKLAEMWVDYFVENSNNAAVV